MPDDFEFEEVIEKTQKSIKKHPVPWVIGGGVVVVGGLWFLFSRDEEEPETIRMSGYPEPENEDIKAPVPGGGGGIPSGSGGGVPGEALESMSQGISEQMAGLGQYMQESLRSQQEALMQQQEKQRREFEKQINQIQNQEPDMVNFEEMLKKQQDWYKQRLSESYNKMSDFDPTGSTGSKSDFVTIEQDEQDYGEKNRGATMEQHRDNYFDNKAQYAKEIRRKEKTGEEFTDPEAAERFKQEYDPDEEIMKRAQETHFGGSEEKYAREIKRKEKAGESFSDPGAAQEFKKQNPELFESAG